MFLDVQDVAIDVVAPMLGLSPSTCLFGIGWKLEREAADIHLKESTPWGGPCTAKMMDDDDDDDDDNDDDDDDDE